MLDVTKDALEFVKIVREVPEERYDKFFNLLAEYSNIPVGSEEFKNLKNVFDDIRSRE